MTRRDATDTIKLNSHVSNLPGMTRAQSIRFAAEQFLADRTARHRSGSDVLFYVRDRFGWTF